MAVQTLAPRCSEVTAPPGMVFVPGGTFRMGSDRHDPEEAPVHRVTVDGFFIDRTPVTNAQFKKFVAATGYVTCAETVPDPRDYPGALPHMLKAGSLAFTPPNGPVDLRHCTNWYAPRHEADAPKVCCIPENPRGGTEQGTPASRTRFEIGADGKPVLMKTAQVEFVDDWSGKAVGINRFIGRRPVFAFGNSDGDQQMLEYTAGGNQGRLRPVFDGAMGARFMGIVHHTDAEREYAYDRQSDVGRLAKALDEGRKRGWAITDMKRDWRVIFPNEPTTSGSRQP